MFSILKHRIAHIYFQGRQKGVATIDSERELERHKGVNFASQGIKLH